MSKLVIGCEQNAHGTYTPVVTRGNRVIWRPKSENGTAAGALEFAEVMRAEVMSKAFSFIETVGS